MTNYAKWAWLLLLCFLFLGGYALLVFAADVAVFFIVRRFKPEWLDRL